jgi:small nuclear ribonucleoprotein (snRNP)-like protein
LSQIKEGLQNSLNILHDFCYAWKLKVNTDKSKIMVFNSNGKTYLNQFTYNNVDLETVANYCYLGMVLKFNGNFNLAINTLMEKARKANFKIKKTIGLNNPCRLLEKLFYSLVTPILTYGSEVWGVDSTFKDSDPFEKLHIKFIKEILGIHCKASNDGCRAELNRTPLKSKILFSIFNFMNHIISSKNTLVYDIYIKSRETNPWVKNVKKTY